MKRRTTSLRMRMTGLCSLLALLVLGHLGLAAYQRERAALEHGRRSSIEAHARFVAAHAASSLQAAETRAVAEFLGRLTQTLELQAAAVYAHDGVRLASAGDPSLLPASTSAAFEAEGDWIGSAAMPYTENGDLLRGVALVRASGEPLRQQLGGYAATLVFCVAIAVLVFGLATHWLGARLLRPVRDLLRLSDWVDQTKDFRVRADDTATGEIGALARGYNTMLVAIQERDAHLENVKAQCDQQVRLRTADLSRALELAESATHAKSTFVANMSHEVRTPLNAVLGMTDLAMEAEDPREMREYLGVIRSAGSSLLGILSDVLDLSKIEAGKLELSPIPVDLESLVLDAMRPLTSRSEGKDLELTVELAPELSRGYSVDDVRLRQILTNLVGNAIKFTEQGFVRVSISRVNDLGSVHEVEILVQDSGVGIPQDRLKAIFTPFTQADNTITRRYAGTGLGLSITERLVVLMGGIIHVESTPGTGTTFRIRLPIATCESPLPAAPALPPACRLVLVSRSSSMQQAIAAIGRRLQVETMVIEDHRGLAAMPPLGDHDVVLLDDHDNDAEICAALALGTRRVRPVLVVTSFLDLGNAAARCRASNFMGYITKPVSARELAVRMTSLLHPGPGEVVHAPTQTVTASPARTAPLRILVAEDNALNQKLIERILQRDGHSVKIAENGRICCEMFASEPFDLILMDMQMPEMSGLEATTSIRQQEGSAGSRVPIIALTANTMPEDRRACLDAGMDEVLPKPVSLPLLRTLLAGYGSKPGAPPRTGDKPGA
ncbi:MAG TPA: response regulator [Planctomycetota bacterium]|nr:response regulator [Planctomycetota bacterium]